MEFSVNDMITPEEILSEVLMYTRQERYDRVTKGFILSQMNKCLEDLSYHTFFHESSIQMKIPSNRILEIPPLVFNIRQAYLYNGDSCNISNAQNIYHKRNYYHTGSGKGVSRNKEDNGNDPFYANNGLDDRASINYGVSQSLYGRGSDDVYFYGYQSGYLYLSPSCSNFSNILIKLNGVWQLKLDSPCIPRFLRQVLVDWCTEKVFKALILDNPNVYRVLWRDAVTTLGRDQNSFTGSWYAAETLIKRMGSKQREDLNEYLSRLNY